MKKDPRILSQLHVLPEKYLKWRNILLGIVAIPILYYGGMSYSASNRLTGYPSSPDAKRNIPLIIKSRTIYVSEAEATAYQYYKQADHQVYVSVGILVVAIFLGEKVFGILLAKPEGKT